MRDRVKVLVVDDEMPIRQEISTYHWEENGFQLIGTARNGKIALNMCRSGDRPDIVITDITMPVMDGLELIGHLRSEFPEIKYIILTCHQDFEYAKKAIQYHVVDYLLKSDICEETIFSVLQKTQESLKKEHSQIESIKQTSRVELAELLNADTFDTGEIKCKLSEMGIDISRYPSVMLLFVENRILSWIVVELAVRVFISEYEGVENWIIVDQGCYCLVMEELNEQKAYFLLRQLDKIIQDKFSYAVDAFFIYGVMLDVHGSISRLMDEFRRLDLWKEERFINPRKKLFYAPVHCFNELNEVLRKDFMKVLEESKSENIVQNVARWERKNRILPLQMKQILVEALRRKCEIHMPDTASEILGAVFRSCDMEELSDVLLQIYQEEEEYGGRYEIRRARKIIEEQYSMQLSLVSVAQQVNLSPQYFSKLFSETVGINFGDYLMNVRMRKSQELILTSDKKVYEIAEEVGIPNYRYFTALFKKYYGVTPKEYKNKGIRR